MRRRIGLTVVLLAGIALCVPAVSTARSGTYYTTFRSKYGPVQTALNRVGTACGYGAVTRVDQMPACGRRVAPFRTALAGLLIFLTDTPPAPKVKAEVALAIATTRVLQQRFTALASIIARKDLAGFKAMTRSGAHPIDKPITAFNTALNNLEIDLL